MTFGKQLAEKRTNLGISQQKVADQMEYSTAQFISNWERDVSFPPPKALEKLSRFLKWPIAEMRMAYINTKLADFEKDLRKALAC